MEKENNHNSYMMHNMYCIIFSTNYAKRLSFDYLHEAVPFQFNPKIYDGLYCYVNSIKECFCGLLPTQMKFINFRIEVDTNIK